MSEIICDTSPIQYLHQLDLLHIFQKLVGKIIVPPDVANELEEGRIRGYNLPEIRSLNWVSVRTPISMAALPLVKDLGPGESQVLALALESKDSLVILDDFLAREVAQSLNIKFRGALGILLDAKKAGFIPSVAPLIDQLQKLSFRLSKETRINILKLAGELG